jgi:hypothetical protein
MATRITEVTRRDLIDALSGVPWNGRLEEIEFLSRLYDLDEMPSDDRRFTDARSDIIQHRLANDDWDDDWVFYDERFGLADEDEPLLAFLAEMLHPAVRPERAEAEKLATRLNGILQHDGYKLEAASIISGRPVYEARYVGKPRVFTKPAIEAPRHFTDDVRPLVLTVAKLAELDGSELENSVLREADPKLGEGEYDNWNGGTYYHTLTLEVPVSLFARLGERTSELESQIKKRIETVLRSPDTHFVSAVVIQPALISGAEERVSDVVTARSKRPVPQFWAPGRFRLFISHVTSFKQRAAALRQDLLKYHISGFVAHETIDPGELWQREIEAALRTMDAFTALLTPDFHESKWTDQEIGFALGLDSYVLPIRRGADPYGFIGEVQGIQGLGKTVSQVAEEVFAGFLRHGGTRPKMLEALVAGFERSDTATEARATLTLLEVAGALPDYLVTRVEVAAANNELMSRASDINKRIEKLLVFPR